MIAMRGNGYNHSKREHTGVGFIAIIEHIIYIYIYILNAIHVATLI
jgi:hypothetical protein